MTNEDAIKMLKSKLDGTVDTSYEWCECVRMAIKALEQEPKTGWIPVSERLPKKNGCYLVTIQAFGQHTFMKVVSFATNLSLIDKYDFKGKEQAGWYGCDSEYGYYEMDDVIAWQPLPKPYKLSEIPTGSESEG